MPHYQRLLMPPTVDAPSSAIAISAFIEALDANASKLLFLLF